MTQLWYNRMHSIQYKHLFSFLLLQDLNKIQNFIGWGTTVLCTALMVIMVHFSSLNAGSAQFIVVFSASLVMWIFRLLPESIPALFIIVSTLLLNIKPQHIILSGFLSDSFFLTLSLFGIGFILVKSRLFYRFSLYILYYLPPKHAAVQKALFALGTLMTPLISVQSARVALMAPFVDDIITSSKIKAQSDTANALASAAFNGCILLSTIFLTGKSSNSVLYAMISSDNGSPMSWFHWLLAASVPGILLITAFFYLQKLVFNQNKSLNINKLKIKRELIALKEYSFEEYGAFLSTITLVIGVLLSSWFQLSTLWTCIAVFFVLFFTGSMELHELKKGINWTFLFYLGAIIGIMRYIQTIGVDLWIGQHLHWLVTIAHGNIIAMVSCIYLLSWLAGLVLGTMTAPALLFTVLMPLTQQAGVSSWLVAFIILMATEAWVFPYQSTYFLCFEELLKKKNLAQIQPMLRINTWLVLIKLAILLVSLPFWRCFGLI